MFSLHVHITTWYLPFRFKKVNVEETMGTLDWDWYFSIGCFTLTKFN